MTHPAYSTLYDDQKQVVDTIATFLQRPPEKGSYLKLAAAAGFGKSYLISTLPLIFSNYTFIYCAPTDSAVAVLRDLLDNQGLHKIETRTAHSLLNIRVDYDDAGVSFSCLSDFKPSLEDENRTVVVFDECSMASSIFLQATETMIAKFIFVGDPSQLPPVKGAPLFNCVDVDPKFDCRLTIPKRSNNPEVQAAVDRIRIAGFQGIEKSQRVGAAQICGLLCDRIQEGHSARFISYRHKIVNEMAAMVRYNLYQKSDGEHYGQDELVRLANVMDGPDKIIKNNATMVVDYSDETMIAGNVGDQYFVLPFVNKEKHDELFSDAKKSGQAKVWRKYYRYLHSCARVSSVYASTVHCAQGLTLDYVFFNLPDLERFGCPKILYTAASRGKNFYVYC